MKRASNLLAGISVLLISLVGLSFGSALAMGSNSSSCENSGFPSPYTVGAGVAKFFHLSDGSTVTITTTGAVIKQSPCHTAYREGWISVSDICNIQTAQDLNGHLSAGSSNPHGSGDFEGCSSSTSSIPQRPAETTAPTQTQSQSITVNVPQVQGATTTKPTTQSTSAVKTLPNTGPGNILALSGATTAIGTVGHWYYSRRSRHQK